ncbi:hypothetical protein NE237_014780 [Protea cynaroides]|uniref:Uncharacterized protein n=1 Tax=Protea cynaroides TaxID=273540 RepID=A0A9Q0KCW3_9MAGN|nr:hypothetical protein NE237_014780 [Protea cynaroides]
MREKPNSAAEIVAISLVKFSESTNLSDVIRDLSAGHSHCEVDDLAVLLLPLAMQKEKHQRQLWWLKTTVSPPQHRSSSVSIPAALPQPPPLLHPLTKDASSFTCPGGGGLEPWRKGKEERKELTGITAQERSQARSLRTKVISVSVSQRVKEGCLRK